MFHKSLSGLLVGALVAKVTDTPKQQRNTVLVACGFGNSSGLAITLLSALHANSSTTSDLGRVDPTLFLSIYLLLYPVLQWGIGGWLLAPPLDHETEVAAGTKPLRYHNSKSSLGPTNTDLDPQNIAVLVAPPHHVQVLNNCRPLWLSGDERSSLPTR